VGPSLRWQGVPRLSCDEVNTIPSLLDNFKFKTECMARGRSQPIHAVGLSIRRAVISRSSIHSIWMMFVNRVWRSPPLDRDGENHAQDAVVIPVCVEQRSVGLRQFRSPIPSAAKSIASRVRVRSESGYRCGAKYVIATRGRGFSQEINGNHWRKRAPRPCRVRHGRRNRRWKLIKAM